MAYYIEYKKSGEVRIGTKRPAEHSAKMRAKTGYFFFEGPFKTQKSVKYRLNKMDIPNRFRPVKFRGQKDPSITRKIKRKLQRP